MSREWNETSWLEYYQVALKRRRRSGWRRRLLRFMPSRETDSRRKTFGVVLAMAIVFALLSLV
jgi:hypothetical protein